MRLTVAKCSKSDWGEINHWRNKTVSRLLSDTSGGRVPKHHSTTTAVVISLTQYVLQYVLISSTGATHMEEAYLRTSKQGIMDKEEEGWEEEKRRGRETGGEEEVKEEKLCSGGLERIMYSLSVICRSALIIERAKVREE